MFETLVSLFVKRYLTRYFNLNADQLSTQFIYKRQIIIENLVLNQEILNNDIRHKWKLPFEIESFQIDRIEFSFILSSFFFRSSSPAFIIKIQGVHGHIKSISLETDDLLSNSNDDKSRDELNLFEQNLEKEFECFGEVKSSRWNIQRLFVSLVEKSQIEINDVHIRYDTPNICSLGFTCETVRISNEVCRIVNPGVYINIDEYVLSPPSTIEIHLVHNHFYVNQKEYRYELICSLNHLKMQYSIEQMKILVELTRRMQSESLRRMLISDPSRPREKPSKQSAKSWWHYAILAVLRIQTDSTNYWFNRSLFVHRLHQLTVYQRLYRLYLDSKYFQSEQFSIENQREMNELERDFDVKYLVIIRRSIFQRKINEQTNRRQQSTRWYSNYAKWITTKMFGVSSENDQKLQEQVNTFIAETLEDDDLAENYQNSLIFRLNFSLQSIELDLLSSKEKIHFSLHLKNLSVNTEYRLRHRSTIVSASLDDLYICDHEQIELFSKILCSKQSEHQMPMFELSFEKKMKSKSSIYSIDLRSCGFSIVCCPTTMKRLRDLQILTLGYSSFILFQNWKKIRNYLLRKLATIWERLPIRRRIETTKVNIQIDIGAPKIIIPNSFIIDLGSVVLTTDTDDDDDEFLTPDSSPVADDYQLENETNVYPINIIVPQDNSYSLIVRDIQIGDSLDQSQIVETFNVNFSIKQPQNNLWTLSQISSSIPKINIRLNTEIIHFIHPWMEYFKQPSSFLSIYPRIDLHLDEINIYSLFDLHVRNLDLAFNDKDQTKNLIFTLQNVTIFDRDKQESILKMNTNERFIRLRITPQYQLTVDLNADQFDLNINSKLFNFREILFDNFKKRINQIHYQLNGHFHRLNLEIQSTSFQIDDLSLKLSCNPLLTFDIQIFNQLHIFKQSQTSLRISNQTSNKPALHLTSTSIQLHSVYLSQLNILTDLFCQLFSKNVNRMDFQFKLSVGLENFEDFVENIQLLLDFQIKDQLIAIHSKLTSNPRVFLSRQRIQFVQDILNTWSQNENASKLHFDLESSELSLILQNDDLSTIYEGQIDQCQMSYRKDSLVIQLPNFRIRDLGKFTAIKLTKNQQKIDVQLEKVDLQLNDFNFLTKTILSKMKLEQSINIHIDFISCLLLNQLDMNLQSFNGQIQFQTIQGQLNSLSIRDLSHNERLRTNDVHFDLIIDEFPYEFNSQIASVQYIHAQAMLDFLFSLPNSIPVNRFNINIDLNHLTFIIPELVLEFESINLKNHSNSTVIQIQNGNFANMSILRRPFQSIIRLDHSSIQMYLSSFDLLFDFDHYQLIRNLLFKLFNASKSMETRFSFAISMEIEQIGLELVRLCSLQLTNTKIVIDRSQTIHLSCSQMKIIDIRNEFVDLMIPLAALKPNINQLELHFERTRQCCTITMDSTRFLIVIDWLISLNDFLNSIPSNISLGISFFTMDFQFHLNQFEFILSSSTINPYANALIYSSSMLLQYQHSSHLLELLLTDMKLLTCQIGNIDETAVVIIEPTDCSLNIQQSNDIRCELTFSILNIRVSYSDIQLISSLIQTINQQISQVKTLISSILTSPNQFLKILCDEIHLCLIDDCFGVNIPLVNLKLKTFLLQTIENNSMHRTDQCEFDLLISYYNRFQSGFEPFIEPCGFQLTLTQTSSIKSLFISAKDTLNLNLTKAMYCLYETIRKNQQQQQTKTNESFRRVKPLDPYCFTNLLGIQVKFRIWTPNEQCFSSFENLVDNNQTISFSFPTRSNSIAVSLFKIDRRLSISLSYQYENLQPISIDRVGTFFRLAVPKTSSNLLKPLLVMIDIAMKDNTIRTITIRSSIEIKNHLLTSIEIRLKTHEEMIYEMILEPNESRSLPIQFCSNLKELHIRPANFALDYCDEPISWSDIDKISQNRISFLRSCSIGGKEAVYYFTFQSKQTCRQSVSIYKLSILPPLIISNLLPCSLDLEMPLYPQKLQLNPYETHREHALNILELFDLRFTTDIYRMNRSLQLPPLSELTKLKSLQQKVCFYDQLQRELLVDVNIDCIDNYRLKISISVPYILLNKTGIPLIFKDNNSKLEAAGQTIDDESMINHRPLLFSSNTCVMRVGTGLHNGRPQWSQRFDLQHGSTYRQLTVRQTVDYNYSIGIDIRPGNGHLKNVNFIFLSARYIICNQCSFDLQVTQRALKENSSTCIRISKQATAGYHWPRTDIEQLLCVRILIDEQSVNWSGAFSIDDVDVFHVNMRNERKQCFLLRVQIIERHGTFFVIFMDSKSMPAPFRIVNRSSLPIQFCQTDVCEQLTCVQPGQSIDYALDEPRLKPLITCSVAEGSKGTYDLLKLGRGEDLTYPNYLHLMFPETSDRLVIEFVNNRVLLGTYQENKRSQMWLLTNNNLLVHAETTMVLDVEELTTNNYNLQNRFSLLTVRKHDPKRSLTQTWQLSDRGYLILLNNHQQLCAQVFGELKETNDVVLGPISNEHDLLLTPIATMYICAQQQYEGNGILSVRVLADGPTNVLEIDHKNANDSLNTSSNSLSTNSVYHLDLHFPAAVGLSLIGSIGYESEELIYALVHNLHIIYQDKNNEQSIEGTIENLTVRFFRFSFSIIFVLFRFRINCNQQVNLVFSIQTRFISKSLGNDLTINSV